MKGILHLSSLSSFLPCLVCNQLKILFVAFCKSEGGSDPVRQPQWGYYRLTALQYTALQ